ncbi:Rv2231c family pyridoxal phosphate-dependent protein CobC [Oryzihumus leptocrescens]|uniref:Histidinol-phosphate aminotransferase n=1 Tax=Oryzihumus leptocrescens TaxID=297536 RepID=A0A542ZIL5_9MICO|nr:Rv2231c family pyridoxal phosphate-dependent protein CobC [Oryzihumus leptocrescens]TQL60184.1 histidinol-phosphate aminotransferase [Oryzihumus leptocrescens]
MPEVDLRHHGDREIGDGLVDLAVNVQVPKPPPWLLDVLIAALAQAGGYPDQAAAVAAAARAHGCDPASVLLTNGAAEAFTLLARLPWRRPLVVHPQFTEPEAALRAAGHCVQRLVLSGDTGFRLDPDAVDPTADLVIVGNPTNPTSRLHPAEALAAMLRPGRLVVVDEAFMDVTDQRQSLAGLAPTTQGLLVVRSLTKTFGLAGVRAGHLLGEPALVARLAAYQPHWSVNALALAATVACLGPEGEAHRRAVTDGLPPRLSHLTRALLAAGLDVVAEPAGPFVLARHDRADVLRERLRHLGFALRRGDTFPGLGPQWLRVAARDEATTDALSHALPTALQELP